MTEHYRTASNTVHNTKEPASAHVCLAIAQLVMALTAPMHVHSCVQEVRVRSPEQTSSTLASIPPG